MNADAIERPAAGEAVRAREPLYFLSGSRQLFGWLHRPASDRKPAWGVVICKAFGYEALCGHRNVREFAETTAGLGMPALRFDYLGTGDSADIDPNADQIEVWIADIAAAVAELRRRTGVARVCLMGFRLGALLAAVAAQRCPADALALIAPIVSGKRYLREARTAELVAAAAAGSRSPASGPVSGEGGSPGAGAMEVAGYPLSAASVRSLSPLVAPSDGFTGVRDALIIDRSDLPAASAWAKSLAESGAVVDYQALPGFVEMMLTAPQFAKLPQAMLQATRDWLLRLQVTPGSLPDTGDLREVEPSAAEAAQAAKLSLEGQDGAAETRLTERPVFLRAGAGLFGIVTEPCPDETRRRAVILLNTGSDYHIGASRMYVSLARRWARRGYFVLRMDLMGLGDSSVLPGKPDNEVFPPEALEDIGSGLQFMRERYGISDFTLGGLCSGAYHTLRASAAGLPVQRLLMVNPQNYFWDSRTMSLEGLQLAEVVANAEIYRERIFSAAAWSRLLSGQVNIWRIIRVYVQRPLLAVQSVARDLARALGIRLKHDLGRELESIVARGVRVVFVFARGEPGIDLLRLEAGRKVVKLARQCRIRIIDSADHTFSRSEPREVLEEVLSEELFSR
jgi:dienelactone hydrolase